MSAKSHEMIGVLVLVRVTLWIVLPAAHKQTAL